MEDKESHLDVLKDYIKASSRPDEIENIVILKCRNWVFLYIKLRTTKIKNNDLINANTVDK